MRILHFSLKLNAADTTVKICFRTLVHQMLAKFIRALELDFATAKIKTLEFRLLTCIEMCLRIFIQKFLLTVLATKFKIF